MNTLHDRPSTPTRYGYLPWKRVAGVDGMRVVVDRQQTGTSICITGDTFDALSRA